jgi:hypothetical protein
MPSSMKYSFTVAISPPSIMKGLLHLNWYRMETHRLHSSFMKKEVCENLSCVLATFESHYNCNGKGENATD